MYLNARNAAAEHRLICCLHMFYQFLLKHFRTRLMGWIYSLGGGGKRQKKIFLCCIKIVTNHFKLCPFMLLWFLLAFYTVLWCNKDSSRQDFSSSEKKKSLEAKCSVFKIYILYKCLCSELEHHAKLLNYTLIPINYRIIPFLGFNLLMQCWV